MVKEGPGIDSRCCHWIFQWHISFRPNHGPGVDSARSENEGIFPKADNLPPYRAVVMKSGGLNFLESSGPAQACYGRTLAFTYIFEKFVLGQLWFKPQAKSLNKK